MRFMHTFMIMALICLAMQTQLALAGNNPVSSAYDENRCKVGVVPQFEQRRLFAVWKPILEALQKRTGCQFELVGSKTIAKFEEAFLRGDYDFAYMNPYHAVMANDAQGYEPIIRSDAKKLKGILVVPEDSPIQHVKELDGATLAFPSPNALGASLLMRAELATQHGIAITPLYVKTHSSVYLHVAKRLASAGGGVGRTLKEQPDAIKSRLRVLYTTHEVYAHPLVAHPRVPSEITQAVQNAWLSLAQEDPSLFDGIPMKKSVATSMQDYNDLQRLELEKFVGKGD